MAAVGRQPRVGPRDILAQLGIQPLSYGLVVQQARALLLNPRVLPDLAGRHELLR